METFLTDRGRENGRAERADVSFYEILNKLLKYLFTDILHEFNIENYLVYVITYKHLIFYISNCIIIERA